ncbi:hypothetical protein D3C75_1110010 [compost metagenome]
MLDVRHAQVELEATLEFFAILVRPQPLQALPQLTLDNGCEQLVLGREVTIERPATQTDGLHQTIDTYRGKTRLLGRHRAALQQFLSGFQLVTG